MNIRRQPYLFLKTTNHEFGDCVEERMYCEVNFEEKEEDGANFEEEGVDRGNVWMTNSRC